MARLEKLPDGSGKVILLDEFDRQAAALLNYLGLDGRLNVQVARQMVEQISHLAENIRKAEAAGMTVLWYCATCEKQGKITVQDVNDWKKEKAEFLDHHFKKCPGQPAFSKQAKRLLNRAEYERRIRF